MSKVDHFVVNMTIDAQEVIDSTIQILCDKYATNDDDREEIRRAIMGVVHVAEGMAHLKAMHQEIVFKRQAKHVKKE